MAKRKIKADPSTDTREIEVWEKRFPTTDYKVIDGKLVEVPVTPSANVATRKNRR